MIHSLFDSRDQNRDYSNIDYPKENIKTMKKGVMVNGSEVLGTVVINNFYYCSADPTANLGEDGDIYLKS